MTYDERYREDLELIEAGLKLYLSRPEGGQQALYEAMEYSLFAGGKRIRPVLTLEFCRLCGGDVKNALPFACALEMIHTYSLIHDDLPCMDDDDLRRGKPTNHRVFGECMAVLAGDGLLSAAFETMLNHSAGLSPAAVVRAAGRVAEASGGKGMVGGQVLDMAQGAFTYEAVLELQRKKTGALISAACEAGVLSAEGTGEMLSAAREYADCLGLAFQIQDDLLDLEGDAQELGKAVGVDAGLHKRTFPAVLGREESRTLAAELTGRAVAAVAPFGRPEFLQELARRLEKRKS